MDCGKYVQQDERIRICTFKVRRVCAFVLQPAFRLALHTQCWP